MRRPATVRGRTALIATAVVARCFRQTHELFARAADLVRQLIEARDTRELTRLQQRLL